MNKKTKKKMNNKGFSLVELIVVIAIMAILAVTLAPRLSQYVDRARQAADEDIINTIYNSAKLADVENPMVDNSKILLTGTTGTFLTTPASGDDAGAKWTVNTSYTNADNQDFFDGLEAILTNFSLKSNEAGTTTNILLEKASGIIIVHMDYDITDTQDAEDPADYETGKDKGFKVGD